MTGARRPRRWQWVLVAGVLLILAGAAAVAHREVREAAAPVTAYRSTDDPYVLILLVTVHTDDVVVSTEAEESGDRVDVSVTARRSALVRTGNDLGVQRSTRLRLQAPLGGRPVVDRLTGQAVPPES